MKECESVSELLNNPITPTELQDFKTVFGEMLENKHKFYMERMQEDYRSIDASLNEVVASNDELQKKINFDKSVIDSFLKPNYLHYGIGAVLTLGGLMAFYYYSADKAKVSTTTPVLKESESIEIVTENFKIFGTFDIIQKTSVKVIKNL